MSRAPTFVGLAAAFLLPAVSAAQGANASPDPGSPTAERLPTYEIDPRWPPTLPNDWILGDIRWPGSGFSLQRWILKGTRPASSVPPPVQER
jgi:hypothetical protein